MMSFTDKIVNAYAFVKILISPIAIAVILSVCLYYMWPFTWVLYVGLVLVIFSVVLGIKWAINVNKAKGAANYLGRYL